MLARSLRALITTASHRHYRFLQRNAAHNTNFAHLASPISILHLTSSPECGRKGGC